MWVDDDEIEEYSRYHCSFHHRSDLSKRAFGRLFDGLPLFYCPINAMEQSSNSGNEETHESEIYSRAGSVQERYGKREKKVILYMMR